MSSRLRSLDSKISFFAFADIITAVSGVLIFVALLLATDLGVPTDSHSSSQNPELEQQLQEILAQQVEVDAQNQRLQELLSTANTSPDPDKLQADIKRLKAQLADEQKKMASMLQQMSQSQAAIAKRDAELGLTALKAQIEKEKDATKEISAKEADVKSQIATLDQHIVGLQSKLLQLRQREGKLWLIPEKGTTTKEPILAIVSNRGISLERFDHPEKTEQIENTKPRSDFEDFVKTLKPTDEYVVFLIRPSGVALFQDVVKTARERNIEVGFDAIEEDKDIYFTSPPVLDETVPVNPSSGYTSGSGGYSDPSGGGGSTFGGTRNSGGGTSGTSAGAAGGNTGSGSGGFNPESAGGIPNGGNEGGRGETAGGSANGIGTGTATGSGSQTGSSYSAGTAGSGNGGTGSGTGSSGSEARKGAGNGKGKGEGNSNSTKAGNGNGSNGNASAKTNTPTSEVKKDDQKTNSVPVTKPSTPAAKSWWQRFLEWLRSFFK